MDRTGCHGGGPLIQREATTYPFAEPATKTRRTSSPSWPDTMPLIEPAVRPSTRAVSSVRPLSAGSTSSYRISSGDSQFAAKVAATVQANGLSVWLDLIDPGIDGDGPDLADYIHAVLRQSKALLAVVTVNTARSWWVPFEIGIAFELSRYLASFGDKHLNPSFLAKWPNIPDNPRGRPGENPHLQTWCRKLKVLSDTPTASSYLAEMRSMSRAY